MTEEKLYRTNSFTGNDDPFVSPVTALTAPPTLQEIAFFSVCRQVNLTPTTEELVTIIDNLDATGLDHFLEQSDDYRHDLFADVIAALEEQNNVKMKYACWFTAKEIVMSRKNGYGRRLCKENGVLFCEEPGFILFEHGFDSLVCFETKPVLKPDILTNNRLISALDLELLLKIEAQFKQTLTDTCLKKDVKPILKRYQMGLLGKQFSPPAAWQEEHAEQRRQEELFDLL